VTRVVPHDELDAAVRAMTETLAGQPPGVMRMGRDSFYAVVGRSAAESMPYLHSMLTVTSQTAEAVEGVAAFAEKRAPAWRADRADPD